MDEHTGNALAFLPLITKRNRSLKCIYAKKFNVKTNSVKYYLKYQCATAPDITMTWQPTINSEIHINPMRYTHHMYLTQVGLTYSTRVNARAFNNSLFGFHLFVTHAGSIWLHDTLLLKLSREKSIFFSSTNGLFSPTELKFKGSNMLFLYICTDFVSG